MGLDDIVSLLIGRSGVALVPSLLVVFVWIVAREKYKNMVQTIKGNRRRIARLERSLFVAGIRLLDDKEDMWHTATDDD